MRTPSRVTRHRALLISLIVLAALLRLAASCNDLSIDEIWTLCMIQDLVRQPADLIRGEMLHDNNHLLNSVWMYLLGPHQSPVLYRLPAIVAGTAAVYAAWLFGKARSPASAAACAVVVAIDHVLVHAGSEARGYGVLALAVIAAQVAILAGFGPRDSPDDRGDEVPVRPICTGPAVAFNLAALIGFLAHLTFVSCYGAALIWSVWRLSRDTRESAGRRLATLVVWHAAPLLLLAALACGFVRGMDYGRGPKNDFFTAVIQTGSALVGGPLDLPWAYPSAAIAIISGAWALIACARYAFGRALLMLLVIIVMPATLFVIFPVEFNSVKHLQVPAQTVLLLVASEAAVAAVRWPRPLTLAVFVGFCVANLARDATLIGRGRGEYVRSIRHMIDQSDPRTPIVTAYSNHDFRTQLLIGYHQANMPGRRIRLYGKEELPEGGADWYILDDHRHGGTGAPRIADRYGNVYDRDLIVRGGGIAPLHWYLYRRVGSTGERP